MENKIDLEALPDEILIEICLYLSTFDIVYAFGRLNYRFQRTIAEFRSELNLSLFSLNQFKELYSPSFLNFICERLTKLSLSNEYCPGQIELFEKIMGNVSYEEKLPCLKSLTFSEFTNENVTILSKILYIEELFIDFDSYEKLTNEVEILINCYIFATHNHFRKVTIYTEQGLQLKPQIESNKNLEDLTIGLGTVNDLFVLFTVAPCLIRLEVDINRHGPTEFVHQDIMPKLLTELYLHTKDKQIMPFERMLKPLLGNIPSIDYLSFGIRTNDPDYAEGILWANFIHSMPNITTCTLGLEIDITTDLLIRQDVDTIDELKQTVFASFSENLASYSVSIYTNTHTLFIDSVPYRFNRDQSYSTSPEAVYALNTDVTAAQQSSVRIVGLSMTGEHTSKSSNDYLNIISRFPGIKWLALDSINISDEDIEEDTTLPISLKLKYLDSLFYMRSTLCKVNRNFFDRFFCGHKRLNTLKMMYGDLVYLLRTASTPINGNHIKNLVLWCNGADGNVRLIDSNRLILSFPLLEHFHINLTSSKLIEKNQCEIINELVTSIKRLNSFRIRCQRGTLKLACSLMEDEQTQFNWLTHINAQGSHLILRTKSLTLWKNH